MSPRCNNLRGLYFFEKMCYTVSEVLLLTMKNFSGGTVMDEIEFRYDTQLLIDAEGLDEDELDDYITEHFVGDSLLVIGDDETVKIHFHTNEPWKLLEYCATLGEIYDIVVEDMDRQSRGLKG